MGCGGCPPVPGMLSQRHGMVTGREMGIRMDTHMGWNGIGWGTRKGPGCDGDRDRTGMGWRWGQV